MKKFLCLPLVALFILASCKKDSTPRVIPNPQVNFAEASITIPKGCTHNIKVIVEAAPAADLAIPITITGGEANADYKVIEGSVTIPAGQKIGWYNVAIPSTITEGKTLTLKLGAMPEGYDPGHKSQSVVTSTLTPTTVLSFLKTSDKMQASNLTVEIALTNQDGTIFKPSSNTDIVISVDPEASTAVEGTHFKMLNGGKATVAKNKSTGTFKIERLLYAAGRDKIVFKCNEAGYAGGAVPMITVTIVKDMNSLLVGQWKGLEYYELDFIATHYGLSNDNKALLADISAADVLNFKADGTFEVALSGVLKNYFRNGGTWLVNGSKDIFKDGVSFPRVPVSSSTVELSKVFPAFNSSTDMNTRAGTISVYMLSTAENPEILWVQINDYTSSFENLYPFDFIWGDGLNFLFVRK